MYIVKVLKRKDSVSVMLAIILAMSISGALNITYFWTSKLITSEDYQMGSWRDNIAQPAVNLLLQLILIEVGLRVVIFVRGKLVRRVK